MSLIVNTVTFYDIWVVKHMYNVHVKKEQKNDFFKNLVYKPL